MIARVAVSHSVFAIDKPYDYLIPQDLISLACPGVRVIVPFGKGNKKVEGVILSLTPSSEHKGLKSVFALLDDIPTFSQENIKLAIWVSDRFFCTVFDALRAMLPAGMWPKKGQPVQMDKKAQYASLNISTAAAIEIANQLSTRAPQQSAIMKLLAETEGMSVGDIYAVTGSARSSIVALEKSGLISITQREVLRRPAGAPSVGFMSFDLNSEQQKAYTSILQLMHGKEPEAALLFGITGSGKTMIYVKLVEQAISLCKTAIVLVPEIALTPQMVAIFSAYFGDSVAVLHSSLGAGERVDEWKRIQRGEVSVVVGTRSAIFAPLQNLGLIVIDEEQEHTYRSDQNPRYHARDIAKYLVTRSQALLLLSSATPSVESMYNATLGKYKLFRIDKRFNEQKLPHVIISDMKQELKSGNTISISSALRTELDKNINAGQQSILFINRRGTSPIVLCGECGYTFLCARCSISLTYHSKNERLLCHYCGFFLATPASCPDCSGILRYVGYGTQKVEAELLEIFPNTSVIRMDSDTVTRKGSHSRILADFRNKKYQILLGTQMITKGLDFDNVTLVGVISADQSMHINDYRAHERTFSLITQVVGRSGRGESPGRAVIQTFSPNHDVIKLASRQDYDGFFKRELLLRKTLGGPPISDLICISAYGIDETDVIAACKTIHRSLKGYFSDYENVVVFDPVPAPVVKVKDNYKHQLFISCNNTKKVREVIAHTTREFTKSNTKKSVSVYVDVNV